jgi:beta-xylosidase
VAGREQRRRCTLALFALALSAVLGSVGAVVPIGSAAAAHDAVDNQHRSKTAGLTSHPASSSYQNPVETDDAPDPDVVEFNGTYFAFTTGSLNGPIQLFTSTNLSTWSAAQWPGPLEQDASWSTFGKQWAPSVTEIDEEWILYYATEDAATGSECVTFATATSITGPYFNNSLSPLECQGQGSIDPSVFRASPTGAPYLLWKSNGSNSTSAGLWSEELSPDGQSFQPGASATLLLTQTEPWETTVENPNLVFLDGVYLLLYSGGNYADSSYGTGYALCDGPNGPCDKPRSNPLMASTSTVLGPGGAAAFQDRSGRWWVAYAASAPGVAGYGFLGMKVRSLRIDRLCVRGDTVEILGPTVTEESLRQGCPGS